MDGKSMIEAIGRLNKHLSDKQDGEGSEILKDLLEAFLKHIEDCECSRAADVNELLNQEKKQTRLSPKSESKHTTKGDIVILTTFKE